MRQFQAKRVAKFVVESLQRAAVQLSKKHRTKVQM